MNISIQRLSLENFKCFKQKEFSFTPDVVTIAGRNGAGKTTIADAILWCLFGKNAAGQADFDLKTHDEAGLPIPHLDHSVELTLLITTTHETSAEGKIIILRRTLKETWVKKRGSNEQVFKNNTTEYLVNGEVYTAADYKRYIASLIDENIFRAITSPTYFTSLKWQDQRQFLTKIAGEIDEPTDNEEFIALLKELNDDNEDIISYRKHLSYQIKQLKDRLDKIPIRLEEQHKALPEKQDWQEIQKEYRNGLEQLATVEEKIQQVKTGDSADLKRRELRCQISATTMTLDKLEIGCRDIVMEAEEKKARAVQEASIRFNEALNRQKLIEQAISTSEILIERCESCIADCDKKIQQLRDSWPVRKFEPCEQTDVCPTCGQPLPEEMRKNKIKELFEAFNRQLEEERQQLRNSAASQNKIKEDATRELKATKEKLAEEKEQLEEVKESINIIFSQKAKLEKIEIETKEQLLSESEMYVSLSKQLKELKEELANVTDSDDNTEQLTALESEKAQLKEELSEKQTKMASKAQYDRIQSLIDGINDEQRYLITQLSELERKEDIAREYQDRQNTILEAKINEHFQITRWRLFRTVNNGGDPFQEPYCECYDINGTAYHDGLNQAARLNIGLDICNTLCKHYEVSAPIIIDQSESTLNILPTIGQQLRLRVTDSNLCIV